LSCKTQDAAKKRLLWPLLFQHTWFAIVTTSATAVSTDGCRQGRHQSVRQVFARRLTAGNASLDGRPRDPPTWPGAEDYFAASSRQTSRGDLP